MRIFYVLLFLFTSVVCFSQEICDNGIDDDGDGLIDLNDNDCSCPNNTNSNIISNYNFEQINFCPNDFAQFNAVSNWFLPSSATSDYINSCGFVPISAIDAEIYPLPASNGNGVAGILVSQNYKEFIAICTNIPLIAGITYQMNLDISSSTSGRFPTTQPSVGMVCNDGVLNAGKLDITLYGKTNCATNTPLNTNSFPPGWQPLGSATYLPSKNWNQLTIVFTPTVNINSIMIGSPYNLPNTYVSEYDYRSCFPYFYLDNIILDQVNNLGIYINSSGSFCNNTLVLNAVIDSSITNSYFFQWYKDGIAIVGETSNILNINYNSTNIGNYQVKINNSNSCKISPNYNVDSIIDIPDYSIIQSPCFPGTTSLTITTSADEYSFDNGITWSTNPSKSNLTASNNPIKISIKKNGCVSNTRYVILTFPSTGPDPKPDVTIVQPGCQTNGSITINTPAQEYSFDDGVTWTTNPILNNLPPNSNYTYKVRVKSSLGCISIAYYVTLYPFLLPAPSFTKTNAGCGNLGSITITTPAEEYSFDNGVTWTTNSTLSNLNPNSYILKIKNNLGCISQSTNASVGINYIPAPNVTFTHPDCFNGGTITVTTLASEYSFDDGVTWTTNPTAINLPPEYHKIRIKDSSGCESLATLVYLNTFQLPNPDYSITNPTCPTETSTGISITISSVANEYTFDGGITWVTNNSIDNLPSGSYYYLGIRNNENCQSSMLFVQTINQIPQPESPDLIINQPSSCSSSTGIITVTTPSSLYSFDNGLTWSTSTTSSPLLPGNYQVRVKNNNNSCISKSTLAIINSPPDAPETPNLTINQPTTCSNPYGNINVISNGATEYSFDNGITWSTNSNSGNLITGDYEIKVRNVSNCESSVVIGSIIAPNDYPVINDFTITQPDCSNLLGQINITTIAEEYSFDNGITWTTNPISNNLIPNDYYLRIKNSNGCISNSVIATVVPFTNFPVAPSLNSNPLFCIQDNVTLNDIQHTGQNITWYNAQTGGNVLPITTPLQNGVTYYASQTINGCESDRVAVSVTIQNTPAPTGNTNQSFCSTANATLNEIVVTGTAITWYDSLNGNVILSNNTPLADGTTYYATQTVNGCESVARFTVTISLINTLNATDYSQSLCDDMNNGFETINLTNYNSNLITSTGNAFSYYNSLNGAENEITSDEITNPTNYNLTVGNHVIYVRIDSPNTCHQVVEVELTLYSKAFLAINDIMPICEGSSITISAGNGYDDYLWSTGETSTSITIFQPGTYSVSVSENHGALVCTTTKTFTVVNSNIGTISQIISSDWTDNQNTISVLLNSNSEGDYEYSLDGITYQDSPIFTGLSNGEYTVYVNDKNGCGEVTENIYLLMYPKFFTPNGDGYNDYWKIKFSEYEPNLTIKIFDRFGKFIKQISPNSEGWDGTYLGHQAVSTDYWFTVTRQNGKEYKGHFSLKR